MDWDCTLRFDDTGKSVNHETDRPTHWTIEDEKGNTVADTLNRHHCISPEEDRANAKLLASAPRLKNQLEEANKLICELKEQLERLKIKRIKILIGRGPDKISLETNLPDGSYPCTEQAYFDMSVARGRGEEYVKKNFPNVPYKVIGDLT